MNKYRNMECNFFKATLAASVYDLFLRNKPHKRVLDISAGWGDRLLAALSKNLETYLAYDPNTALQSGYKEMINEYIPDEKEKEHYDVVAAPFETAETATTSPGTKIETSTLSPRLRPSAAGSSRR